MKNILLIECSPRPESISRKVSSAIIYKIKKEYPSAQIVTEDLSQNPPPHLNLTQLMAFNFPLPEGPTEEQKKSMELSYYYIEQLRKADAVVVSYPVWNFSIPSSLKAWLDQVVRVGLTFRYLPQGGTEGLLKDKKVYLALARGGVYAEAFDNTFDRPYDFSSLYMKTVLSYMGMKDVMVLKAEGTAVPQLQETALEKALESLQLRGEFGSNLFNSNK